MNSLSGLRRHIDCLILCSGFVLLGSASLWGDGRFIVPLPGNASSPASYAPPPPPAPIGRPEPPCPPSEGPPSPPPPPSRSESERFIVPLPSPREHLSDNRGSNPSYRHSYGGPAPCFDSYWGGCYYWNGSYYYWDGDYYSPDCDRFGRYRGRFATAPDSISSTRRALFFFPPTPPPLGTPPPPKSPETGRIDAPPDLAQFVNEPFYTPLGTRLQAGDLSRKQLQRLERWRAKKNTLCAELIAEIDHWRKAAPTLQLAKLEAFSRQQATSIHELETEADRLRTDLLQHGLIGLIWGSGNWNDGRPWKLGVGALQRPRHETLAYEFKVVRAAVYYQEGFTPAERRLLRELAMELQIEAFRPYLRTETPEEPPLFFQPETARIRVSSKLPPEVATQLTVFRKEKTQLKSELRDAIDRLDAEPEAKRVLGLRQLAERHAGRLDNLEVLAEEIRKLLRPQDVLPDQNQLHQPAPARAEESTYRDAVLLPGLSPEQRRLLYDSALEKLALPLPAGENLPW